MTVVYASIILSTLIIARIPYALWKTKNSPKEVWTKADFNPWGSFLMFLAPAAFYALFFSAEVQSLNAALWWFNVLNIATFTAIGFMSFLLIITILMLMIVKASGQDIVEIMNKKKEEK